MACFDRRLTVWARELTPDSSALHFPHSMLIRISVWLFRCLKPEWFVWIGSWLTLLSGGVVILINVSDSWHEEHGSCRSLQFTHQHSSFYRNLQVRTKKKSCDQNLQQYNCIVYAVSRWFNYRNVWFLTRVEKKLLLKQQPGRTQIQCACRKSRITEGERTPLLILDTAASMIMKYIDLWIWEAWVREPKGRRGRGRYHWYPNSLFIIFSFYFSVLLFSPPVCPERVSVRTFLSTNTHD